MRFSCKLVQTAKKMDTLGINPIEMADVTALWPSVASYCSANKCT